MLLAATACGGKSPADGVAGVGVASSEAGHSTGAATGTPNSGGVHGTGASPARALDLSALSIPKAGKYTYSTSIDLGSNGTYQGVRTVAYFAPRVRGDAAGVLAYQTTQTADGEVKEWWFRFSWRVRGLSRDAETNPSTGQCHLREPFLEIPFPIRVGASWHSAGECREDGTRWTLDGSVARRERITVDGVVVETFVIERAITKADPGAKPAPLNETWWWSADAGLPVQMRTQGAGTPLDLRDALRSLRPGSLPRTTPPKGF